MGFLVCQLAVGVFSLCVWGVWFSWFQVVSWMDATSHFHARPFLNKGETDFMLPAVCSVSPFNLYGANGLLLRSSSYKHAFFEIGASRWSESKTMPCAQCTTGSEIVTVTGTLSSTLFHSSLSVCRFVGKVGLVISRASPECEGTGRVELFVLRLASFWHHVYRLVFGDSCLMFNVQCLGLTV